MLPREEYIEQAYMFRVLSERLPENAPLQDLFQQIRDEVLATTKLPMALDYLLSELKHSGVFATAMAKLSHYFVPFQAYIIQEAENERGRFDMRVAVEVLRCEALYRAESPTPQGVFLYQLETLSRNRLRYDPGLNAIAQDPLFDDDWREWILEMRRQMGILDVADMIFVRSQYYVTRVKGRQKDDDKPLKPILFGEKEGRIALANRRKDPLYLFSALQRHLGYPVVPRTKPPDEAPQLIPQIMRRLERIENRLKLLEEEQRGGIDLAKFYKSPAPPEIGEQT
jgi:hypothetical protein